MMWFTCNVCGTKLYDGSSAICHQDECRRPTSIDDWCDDVVDSINSIPTIEDGTKRVIETLIRGHVNTLKEQFE